MPIIAVTGWGTELDRVLGLQAGADDYLVKPYGFRELMARMHAVMRRSRPQAHSEQVLLHGPLRIDAASREVSLQGRVVEVTRKEFDLLYLLACHPETVIPASASCSRSGAVPGPGARWTPMSAVCAGSWEAVTGSSPCAGWGSASEAADIPRGGL